MPDLKEIILKDDSYLTALLNDISNAKKSIDFEVYIFANDSIGNLVANKICAAAKKGIKVRVLVDGVGSADWDQNIVNQMANAGVKTKIFHPLPWKFLHWRHSAYMPKSFFKKIYYFLSKMNSRNHRKLCIIDNNIVYAGSANISDHLIDGVSEKKWRETTARLQNVDASKVEYAFEKAWFGILSNKKMFGRYKLTDNPTFHLNYSWRFRRKYYKQLINKINSSKTRIWVTNAYFVPDSRLLRILQKAGKRGVDVKIILPKVSDVVLESLVSNTFYTALIASGVSIYEFYPTILHTKTLIIDDWYLVGSSNLNYRSLFHDLEVDVEIRTEAAKNDLDSQFIIDITQSRLIQSAELAKQPLYKKLFARFILLFRYWL